MLTRVLGRLYTPLVVVRTLTVTTLALLLSASSVSAQTGPDTSAIQRAARDYIEGWYEGDADRMARAVHSELVKRIVATHPKTGEEVFQDQDSTGLVDATKKGYGTKIPEKERQSEVILLDVFEGAASVKIVAADWIDYLHLVKQDEKWRIVNVLWELKPRTDDGGQ